MRVRTRAARLFHRGGTRVRTVIVVQAEPARRKSGPAGKLLPQWGGLLLDWC